MHLRDVRKEGLITKSAIGPPAIAKRVAAAGGNALIVDGQDVRTTDFVGGSISYASGNNAYASGYASAIETTSTRMVVVNYFDAQ